jgi:hypothetical protein
MVRLREIPRTATFAWSPGTALPLIATGTKAGAVDADFSNETVLELWDLGLDQPGPQELRPSAKIATDSGYILLCVLVCLMRLTDILTHLVFMILLGAGCMTTIHEE